MSSLGFGNFGVFLVHLFSTKPETLELSSEEEEVEEKSKATRITRKNNRTTQDMGRNRHRYNESSTSRERGEGDENNPVGRSQRPQEPAVVSLLDESEDETETER